MKKAKKTHKHDLNTVLMAQGARVKIMKQYMHNGMPAYDVISPFSKDGEPWAISESWLETSRKTQERPGEFKEAEANYKKWLKQQGASA